MSRPDFCLDRPVAATTINRRLLLKRTSLLVGASLLAPIVSKWSPKFSLPSVDRTEAERIVDEILIAQRTPGFFTADAQVWELVVGAAIVVGAVAAITQILQYFNIRPNFGSSVRYDNAAQCKENFQRAESMSRQSSQPVFSGVSRSPHDNNEAVLVAASEPPSQNPKTKATLITQYDENKIISLDGLEPDVVHSATKHLAEKYNLTGKDLVLAASVIDKKHDATTNITTLRTVCGGFIKHDCGPFPGKPFGQLSLHVPRVTEVSRPPILVLKRASS